MSKDCRIYSNDAMAAFLGVPVATFKDWRRRPEGAFIEVGSCANNYGRAAFSYESSLQNLKVMVEARTSAARRAAANKRWEVEPGCGPLLTERPTTARSGDA